MTRPAPTYATAKVTTVADLNPRSFSQHIADDDVLSFVPMKAVEEETGRLSAQQTKRWAEVKKGYTPFQDGDVVFAKITPCMENGKYALAAGLHGGRGAGSTEFHVFRPKPELDPKYLLFFLFSPDVRREAKRNMRGAAGQLRVPPNFFGELEIPVPPLDEQKRIVAEIEKQFTRLDAGVASLKRMQTALKRYRATVLKAACEGDWATVELSEIAEVVTGSTPATADSRNYGDDLPFFKPTDLNAGYNVREARQRLSSIGAKVARTLPERSVLVTCIGATIGKTGLARTPCATNQQINAVIVDQSRATPEWLFWVLTSPYGQHQIKSNASATTLPILNKGRFEKLNVPLPPLADQVRIVAEVERRLSVVDELDVLVTTNLQRAKALRQSILHRAFSGELATSSSPDAEK